MLKEHKKKELLINNLNPQQIEAVLSIKGPLIIFAGAGTGKTKVITHRIVYLLFKDVSSTYYILAITFTNKAAIEMKERVKNLIDKLLFSNNKINQVKVFTFHSFCTFFLKIEAKKIGLEPDFLICNSTEQKRIIKDCMKELKINSKLSNIINAINLAKDNLNYPENLKTKNIDSCFYKNLIEIYTCYQQKLSNMHFLDFGDLIMKTVIALRDNLNLLEYYSNKFKYIMVDEYQDTNYAQYELIKLLSSKHNNICVCGDDDQAIYSWRGADITNILNFERDYLNVKSVKLEQNYRSTSKILSAAYKIINNNYLRKNKKLWTNRKDNGHVKVLAAKDENDEVKIVINLIRESILKKESNFSDFAILYRTNNQSKIFEEEFMKTKIPYNIIGKAKVFNKTEIKSILSYLRFIENQNDDLSLQRIINIPKRGIGKLSIEKLKRFAIKNNLSMWNTINYSDKIKGLSVKIIFALKHFYILIKKLIIIKNNSSVMQMINIIIKYINLNYVKSFKLNNDNKFKIDINNIKEFVSSVKNFENNSSDKSVRKYLISLSLLENNNDSDSKFNENNVTLMTLHLSKGLEFKNVFICGLEKNLFPIVNYSNTLEEERRLMYVGMTRAKNNLYLLWAMNRTLQGIKRKNIPSIFINETGIEHNILKVNKNLNNNEYKIGMTISHPNFGIGTITKIINCNDNQILEILFLTNIRKKIIARFCNIV